MATKDPIKYLKLVTGEELVSETFRSAATTVVRLTHPVRIVVMPGSNQSKPQVGFVPWAPFTDDIDIHLDKSSIIAIMDPIKEIKDNYNSMFSAIIQPASSPLVISSNRN